MSDWRLIDDEAKGGQEILAYSEEGGTGIMLVRFVPLSWIIPEREAEALVLEEIMTEEEIEKADWFVASFNFGERLTPDCYPSHWIPLPSIPLPHLTNRETR